MDRKKNKVKKNRLCRICLSIVKKRAVSLCTVYKNSPIFSHINSIANVNIGVKDGLPNKICSQCLAELEAAVSFKEKCENNNAVLLTSTSGEYTEIAVQNIKTETSAIKIEIIEPEYHEEPILEEDDHSSQMNSDSAQDAICSADADDKYEDDEKPLSALKREPNFKSKAIDLHLQCDDCKEFFKSKCKLRVHWKRVHLQTLLCNRCKRVFKSFKAYHRHQRSPPISCIESTNCRIEGFGKQRKFYCKDCNYTSIRMKDLITHRVIHTGDRPYSCDQCGKTHTQLSSLMAHKESAHKEYKTIAPCQYCGKIFKGRNAIYKHLRSHADKCVQCKLCKKVLKNGQTLKRHMMRHAENKTKQCEYCAKTFYTQAEVYTHKRKVHHQGDVKLLGCDLCDYRSSRKDVLMKHRAKHSGDNVCCLQCGMFIENKQKMIAHQWRHNNKNFICHCGQKFYRKDKLRNHMKSKHSTTDVKEEKLDNIASSNTLISHKISNMKKLTNEIPVLKEIIQKTSMEEIVENLPSNMIMQEISKEIFLFQQNKLEKVSECTTIDEGN